MTDSFVSKLRTRNAPPGPLPPAQPLPPVATLPDPDTLEEEFKDYVPKQQLRGIGSSEEMSKVRELICNAVTSAHDDASRAMERVLAEAQNLVKRIESSVEKHKNELNTRGQKIAHELDSAVQELTRTLEWVEKQSPNLRNPKLDPKSAQLPPLSRKIAAKPQEPPTEEDHEPSA